MKEESGEKMPIGKVVVNAAKATASRDDKQRDGKIIADEIDTAGQSRSVARRHRISVASTTAWDRGRGIGRWGGGDMREGDGSRGLD